MTTIPTRSFRSPLRALLEGEHTWGTLEVPRSRYGVIRHRLVVFPPGLGRDDRVALRLWRTFSSWGPALWLLLEVPLMLVVPSWHAVAIATAACLAAGAATRARAAGFRDDVRTLTVVLATGGHDAAAVARHRDLLLLADRLVRADARLAAGELTTVEHEAEVWRVYELLDET